MKDDNDMLINRTLLIFKYLWETTDESHPMSFADISGVFPPPWNIQMVAPISGGQYNAVPF